MTIESEIAGLTQATTDLLDAVNVRKAALDQRVADATTQANAAAAQAGIATTKATESAASAVVSQNSSQTAAPDRTPDAGRQRHWRGAGSGGLQGSQGAQRGGLQRARPPHGGACGR